ncbi:phosphonate C-P lyase system protein PhnH [Aneurinibacillus terranovensis]|uniref:phosphonate C-P lyase system protein PhnH n=1 Tax=Aneurinibacillus terranovensis TaxID=278991 RepID=UPI000487074F|nr:phosphonate C-P lyase system protein PhnH [Aneurinibacillus terranovensis]
MKLDLVHDIQMAYRKLINSMSSPGLISCLEGQADKIDMEAGCFPSTLVLAIMLLDTEVTFKVFSEQEAKITKRINQLTYAKAVEAENADFIFVLNDAASTDLLGALEMAKIGDLLNPHESATIVVEADVVSSDVASGDVELLLTGPGIEGESSAQVITKGNWVDIRTNKNAEYPLGIDLIFIDPDHHLLCLPRTTQILKQVVR